MTVFNKLSGSTNIQYADPGGLNNIVSHIALIASVDRGGAGFTLAEPYLCDHPNGSYAAYSYVKHYFSKCRYDGNAYFVGSGHVWLGCSHGDVGENEFHPSGFSHIITLYKFVPNNYTISYNGNGASSGSIPNQSATYDSWATLQGNGYTKDGYNFTGWNTQPDGSGASYASGQGVINLTADHGGTVTLYAQWKPWSHTVAYNANGGSGAPGPQTKTYGSVLTLSPQVPVRDGYQFTGWGTDQEDGSADYQPGGLYGADQDGGTVTLFAVWKDITPPVITDNTEDVTIDPVSTENEIIYNWINQDVWLRFSGMDSGAGMKKLELRDSKGNLLDRDISSVSRKIQKEGVTRYTVFAEDNSGNTATTYVTVKIDKTPPALKGQRSNDSSPTEMKDTYVINSNDTIKFFAEDKEGGSGLTVFQLYHGTGDTKEWVAASADLAYTSGTIAKEFTVTDQESYTLEARDLAGNVTIYEFIVKCNLDITASLKKLNGDTVYHGGTLTYYEYGDMQGFVTAEVSGNVDTVTYVFSDNLKRLSPRVQDVSHSLVKAGGTVDFDNVDHLIFEIPDNVPIGTGEVYSVTVTAYRNGEASESHVLNFQVDKLDLRRIRSRIRTQSGMKK